MGASPRPAAEVEIDEALAEALVRSQHPDLLAPVEVVASGWDNVTVRLGEDLAVRLPRRRAAVALVAHEQRWLPTLARRLPLPVPEPVRAGRPGCGYPWPWSIVRWVPGEALLGSHAGLEPAAGVEALASFFGALHRPAPPDAPPNPYRGVPLAARAARVEGHLGRLPGGLDADRLRATWAIALAAPVWTGPPLWVHGDLHPGNLLVRGGRLAGVVDFGDLTAGDPAVDLAVAWMVLPAEARDGLRAATGVDEATWTRARGSALALALAVRDASADDPAMAAMATRTLAAVLEEDGA